MAVPLAARPDPSSPAADRRAPYVRLAVVGLILWEDEESAGSTGASGRTAAGRRSTVGRWLLLHRTEPFEAWDPPGGRAEFGEDLVQAVTREVHEETGLEVQVGVPCYAFLTF
jgi:8-oxo-dGTP pyrophosphatase MutT (NUDIX family)